MTKRIAKKILGATGSGHYSTKQWLAAAKKYKPSTKK